MVGLTARVVLLVGLLSVLVAAHRPFTGRPLERQRAARGGRSSADGLLPRLVLPYHYDIDITPDIYRPAPPFPFDGTVTISVECFTATKVITVNSHLLTIATVAVTVSPDSTITPVDPGLATFQMEEAADFLHITTTNDLAVGAKYTVTITYSGTLTNDGNGIYYDTYQAADGTTKYILSTQLEDISARQMYPCFDEPDLKATFSVTVAHLNNVTALSNMPVIRTDTRPNGWVASVYDVSPIMSTYHVCVTVGEFVYIEAPWQGIVNYPVRVYSRPEVIHLMEWVASMAVQTQRWLEVETGFVYTLPKMDHIGLPTKGGAMENWGLITYGEQYFAVNPETNSEGGKQYTGSIVAHELAHQWYGNLVTAEWWTDIWLNEGFATYYNYYPMEHLGWPGTFPLQLDTQYFMDVDDQKNTSDPVRKQIATPWDAWYSFAGSTYPKGGAMLRQLEGILTLTSLRSGLTNYLTRFQYSNAVTDDFWQSLSEQAAADGYPLDIKAIMDPWLNQMGFPLVTMTRNSDGTARLTQNYFLHPPNQAINVASQWNYKWTIPITVVTAASSAADWTARPKAWFNITETEKILTGLPVSLNDWVLINAKQLMYYRVNYDDTNRAAIVAQLLSDHTKILNESRCSLIDDSFTLARASYIAETTAMETTRYLAAERHVNPWYAALRHTTLANKMLKEVNTVWQADYETYMLSILTPVYDALGWFYSSTETADEQTLRRDILSSTCNYGHTTCSDNALNDFTVYIQNPNVNSINPNNLPLTLCTGVARGNPPDWDIVFDQYQQRRWTPIRDERNAYLFGLACSTNDAVLDRLLSYIVEGILIDSRDQYRATLYLAMNENGVGKVWDYFDNQWTTVPSSMSKWSVLRHITQTWADQASLDLLNQFIAKYPPASESDWNNYNHMQLTVQQNIVWMLDNQDSLQNWIQSHLPPREKITPRGPSLPVSLASFWNSVRDVPDTETFFRK